MVRSSSFAGVSQEDATVKPLRNGWRRTLLRKLDGGDTFFIIAVAAVLFVYAAILRSGSGGGGQ
jgi:hypothetical protein